MFKIFSATLILLFANGVFAQNLNTPATPDKLVPTQQETKNVELANKAWADSWNQDDEHNWVKKRLENGTYLPVCYETPDKYVEIGKTTNFKGMSMTCMQIGRSSRVLWPTRWANFCSSKKESPSSCMFSIVKPGE